MPIGTLYGAVVYVKDIDEITEELKGEYYATYRCGCVDKRDISL